MVVAKPVPEVPGCADCARMAARVAGLEQELAASERARQQEERQNAEQAGRIRDLERELYGRRNESLPPDVAEAAGRDESPDAGNGGASDGGDVDAPAGADVADRAGGDAEAGEADKSGESGEDGPPPKRKRGRQPGAPTPPRVDRKHLRQQIEVLRPDPAECVCPECGQEYERRSSRVSWIFEFDWEATARKIVRLRYRPTCDCAGAKPVVAPVAARLWEKAQLGCTVWAWFLMQVYGFHRPQAAAARDLEGRGLRVPLATLSQGLRRLGALFAPLVAAVREYQAQAAVAQADETRWPVQYLGAGGGRKRHWLWVSLAAGTVLARILETRSADAAEDLLGHFKRAGPAVVLVCDRYSAYKALRNRFPEDFILAFCWAHQRRDFRQVGTQHAAAKQWAEEWMALIGMLFHLARLRREAWQPGLPDAEQGAAYREADARLRAACAELFAQAWDEQRKLAAEWERHEAAGQGAACARIDAQGRALKSLRDHAEGLQVFLDDPRIPMDNNAAERALRGPVISRYTSFGSGSADGARMAATMFTVFGTVRAAGLNPWTWLLDYLRACARNGGKAPEDLTPWLPWCMDAARREALSQPPGSSRPPQPSEAASPASPNGPSMTLTRAA